MFGLKQKEGSLKDCPLTASHPLEASYHVGSPLPVQYEIRPTLAWQLFHRV